VQKNPQSYCPWMVAALYLLSESDPKMIEKHKKIFDKWNKHGLKDMLTNPMKFHFPTNSWRLLN
jgi:isopentenyl-diphosphate delta-isomerase